MKNSFATSENSLYNNLDVVHIEVSPQDVNVERPLGMFDRLKMVVYGLPEPKRETVDVVEGERMSIISDTVAVQLDRLSNATCTSSMTSPQKKPISVLDELDAFW